MITNKVDAASFGFGKEKEIIILIKRLINARV